jgi:hypothetical protein
MKHLIFALCVVFAFGGLSADAWLAAIAGPYAGADMAGGRA